MAPICPPGVFASFGGKQDFMEGAEGCLGDVVPGLAPGMLYMQVPVVMMPMYLPGAPMVETSSWDSSSTPPGGATPTSQPSQPEGYKPGRMAIMAQCFQMVAVREHGQDRMDQVARNIELNSSEEVELSLPDLGVTVQGATKVREFLNNFFFTLPDMSMEVQGVTEEGPGYGSIEYYLGGTQEKAFLGMFPVGQYVRWKCTSSYEFDETSKIRSHKIRFSLPDAAAPSEAQLAALAQCAPLLAATAGGSRLLQEALESGGLSDDMREQLVRPLRENAWALSMSPHGNFVLQKLIVTVPDEVGFLCEAFEGHAVEAAQHQMQSRVLERLLQCCPPEQTDRLMEELAEEAGTLLRHPFGNFVMQAVLGSGAPKWRRVLMAAICADAEKLAKHRIASNVVRKAVCQGGDDLRGELVRVLTADAHRFAGLCRHRTGSFVGRELKLLVRGVAC